MTSELQAANGRKANLSVSPGSGVLTILGAIWRGACKGNLA